jgi:hypothetical protein
LSKVLDRVVLIVYDLAMTNHTVRPIIWHHLDGSSTTYEFDTNEAKWAWMFARGILTEREYDDLLAGGVVHVGRVGG